MKLGSRKSKPGIFAFPLYAAPGKIPAFSRTQASPEKINPPLLITERGACDPIGSITL